MLAITCRPAATLATIIVGLPLSGVAEDEKKTSARWPFVYAIENTGALFPAPPLPLIADLPSVSPLTDPFMWSDGSGRVNKFDEWSRRRAEIKAEIEHYEIGEKPVRPEEITAGYDNGMLTVNVTIKGKTLTLTSKISLPSGDGPFPAVIGIGRGTGSLPADIFGSREIAVVSFNFGQIMSHTQKRGKEPINTLTIAYREDGAKLDKISISNDLYSPEGMGEPARNTIP